MKGIPLRQLYTFSKPGRDPRTWVMSCAHLAVLDTGQIPTEAGDDASETRWFTVTLNRKGEDCQKDLLYELRLEDGDTVLSSSLFVPRYLTRIPALPETVKGWLLTMAP